MLRPLEGQTHLCPEAFAQNGLCIIPTLCNSTGRNDCARETASEIDSRQLSGVAAREQESAWVDACGGWTVSE